jgi:hypothetical protein
MVCSLKMLFYGHKTCFLITIYILINIFGIYTCSFLIFCAIMFFVAGNILLSSFMFSVMKISVTDAYENPTISGNLNCGSKVGKKFLDMVV